MTTLIKLAISHEYADRTARIIAETVDAQPIGHGLALHPSVIAPDLWQVSDMQTGMMVGKPKHTAQRARQSAGNRLSRACRTGGFATCDEALNFARARVVGVAT
jgi:hypothetical protein